MPTQKKAKKNHKQTMLLYGLIAVLLIACTILAFLLFHKTDTDKRTNVPQISLGAMQYDFVSGRAVKRTDASVTTLKAFLTTDAAHEGCPVDNPAYESVVAYTKDETQVFLHYGCGAADSPMYAVKLNGAWRMLSPTNHFDIFNIPDCRYLEANGISKEIAPVCANNVQDGLSTGTPKYSVR